MVNEVIASQSDTWSKIAEWHLVLPPSRPSLYHLRFFTEHLKTANVARPIAILGSTPELRDLVMRLGFRLVYVFDKNRKVYEHMTDLRASSSPEVFVDGDWLDTLSSFRHEFGVVLSDLTSGNLPYDRRPSFYTNIAQCLATDGIFIDKLLFHDRAKPKVEALLAKYETFPINLLYVNYFSCELFFCSELLNNDFTVDASAFYDALRPQCKTPVLSRFLDEAPHVTPPGTRWYYGRSWDKLEPSYERLLETVTEKREESTSPYFRNLRLRVSRPKRDK